MIIETLGFQYSTWYWKNHFYFITECKCQSMEKIINRETLSITDIMAEESLGCTEQSWDWINFQMNNILKRNQKEDKKKFRFSERIRKKVKQTVLEGAKVKEKKSKEHKARKYFFQPVLNLSATYKLIKKQKSAKKYEQEKNKNQKVSSPKVKERRQPMPIKMHIISIFQINGFENLFQKQIKLAPQKYSPEVREALTRQNQRLSIERNKRSCHIKRSSKSLGELTKYLMGKYQ